MNALIDKVRPADMRRLQQRRVARLISRAKTRRRNRTAPACPEYRAFIDLLHRLEKKNRVRRVLLAGTGAAR